MRAAAVLCWEEVGQVGVTAGWKKGAGLGGGKEEVATRTTRVRTDEDRSNVRAWRFTRCLSAWDAEAVEVVTAELQVLFHVVIGSRSH